MKPKLIGKADVIDAPEPIFLHITKEDATKAIPLDPFNCAAALCIKREYKAIDACVMRSTTYVNYGTKRRPNWVRYKTSVPIAREMTAFDRKAPFMPGVYKLSPFGPTSTLEGHKKYNRSKKKKGGISNSTFRHITANIREV